MDRSPRGRRATFTLMPAAYTSAVPVQVSGFGGHGPLTHCVRLVCDSCSSGQCFAFGFLQIPPHGGHPCRSANRSPCRSANRSPCRVGRGLSPPSHPVTTTATRTAPVKALRAMPGAHKKTHLSGFAGCSKETDQDFSLAAQAIANKTTTPVITSIYRSSFCFVGSQNSYFLANIKSGITLI